MDRPPLSDQMRTRVRIVTVASAFLAVLATPMAIDAYQRGDNATGTGLLGVGVVIPAFFALLMWVQVRRWRADPDAPRREVSPEATRTLLVGNLVVFVAASIARRASGLEEWQAWVLWLGLIVAGSFLVYLFARRKDPRLHYLRRPDPPTAPESTRPAEPTGT